MTMTSGWTIDSPDYGGSGRDGCFLVREVRPPFTYAMTVRYGGTATHHVVEVTNGLWTIDKKAYTRSTKTMMCVIEKLCRQVVKGWPVMLGPSVSSATSGVPFTMRPTVGMGSPPTLAVRIKGCCHEIGPESKCCKKTCCGNCELREIFYCPCDCVRCCLYNVSCGIVGVWSS